MAELAKLAEIQFKKIGKNFLGQFAHGAEPDLRRWVLEPLGIGSYHGSVMGHGIMVRSSIT